MVTSVCETGKRMPLVYSIMRIETGKRELGMTIGLFSYQCSSSGHVSTEYLHLCQRHLKIIKSSSQFIISFFPPNLILLYHSLASWSPLFPSPLDLINLQVLFYLLSTHHGEGSANPLQYSCLDNPRDRGAWWAAVYGAAQSWTRLKQLSSSSKHLPNLFTSSNSYTLFQETSFLLCTGMIACSLSSL